MSIDASIAYVETHEDGSGTLHLCDRVGMNGRRDGTAGQRALHFDPAPHDVTCLNGMNIWGGSSSIVLGDVEIARRIGYTRIEIDAEAMRRAVAIQHGKSRLR